MRKGTGVEGGRGGGEQEEVDKREEGELKN